MIGELQYIRGPEQRQSVSGTRRDLLHSVKSNMTL